MVTSWRCLLEAARVEHDQHADVGFSVGRWSAAGVRPGPAEASAGPDHRYDGAADVSYRLLPDASGEGLREAVAAAVSWWTKALPADGPLVAVAQAANGRSHAG